jgi:hypothetical protein
MDTFGFSDRLDTVAHYYTAPSVAPWLSFDGQVYLCCASCRRVLWCNPLFLREEKVEDETCDRCGQKAFALASFRHRLFVECARCGTRTQFDSRQPTPCSDCRGTSYTVLAVDQSSPFPETFGTAFEHRSVDWCVSVAEDLSFLNQTIRGFRSGASFHATCVHLVEFFESLARRGRYEVDGHLRLELVNAAALHLRQVFRETGDLSIGLRGVRPAPPSTATTPPQSSTASWLGG